MWRESNTGFPVLSLFILEIPRLLFHLFPVFKNTFSNHQKTVHKILELLSFEKTPRSPSPTLTRPFSLVWDPLVNVPARDEHFPTPKIVFLGIIYWREKFTPGTAEQKDNEGTGRKIQRFEK